MRMTSYGSWRVEDANDDLSQLLADEGETWAEVFEDKSSGMFWVEVFNDNEETIASSNAIFRTRSDAWVYLRKFMPEGDIS